MQPNHVPGPCRQPCYFARSMAGPLHRLKGHDQLALDAENERLRAIVRTLKDLLFRARSERAPVIDVAQLPLDLDNLAVGVAPSRIGQVNVSAYLPKGCQASLRLLYAQSGRPQ